MNKTTNYQLNQWEPEDQVRRTDFNEDNAKLDAAIKAVDGRVDSLTASKANTTALTALTAELAKKGNCQIVTGQYTGNGRAGSASPITLNFDKKPMFLVVCGRLFMIAARNGDSAYILNSNAVSHCTWEDTSVSWYSSDVDYAGWKQMNEAGTVYYYVALLEV